MTIQMELYELKNLCMEMASLGAANYVKQTTPAKDLISQREAYRLFQECRVKRWQKTWPMLKIILKVSKLFYLLMPRLKKIRIW